MSSLQHILSEFLARLRGVENLYALAIVLGNEGDSVTLAASDEGSMEAALAARYPDVRPSWEDQFWGTRWNPGDFPHMSTFAMAASVDEAVDAITALNATSIDCDTTPDFVAFVARFDQSETLRKAWMRRTISEPEFARLFPEVVEFEQFLDDASTMSPHEQASFWAAAMEDLALHTTTARSAQLKVMNRTEYDAFDALVALGEVAVEPLLQIVERYAHHPPFTEPGTLAHQLHGALSGESKLATTAMFGLQEIGAGVDHETVTRLRAVLEGLVKSYPADGTVGVGAAVAARVLHELRPAQFPPANVDPDTNRLQNAEVFCES